jgi:hypothetical protein
VQVVVSLLDQGARSVVAEGHIGVLRLHCLGAAASGHSFAGGWCPQPSGSCAAAWRCPMPEHCCSAPGCGCRWRPRRSRRR